MMCDLLLKNMCSVHGAPACSLFDTVVEWMPSIFPYGTQGRGRLLSFSNVQFSPVIVPVAHCLSDSQWSYLIDPCTSLAGFTLKPLYQKPSLTDQS